MANDILAIDDLIKIGTLTVAVASSTWFLGVQLGKVKETIYRKTDEIKSSFADKLTYHERHDDDRFDNIEKQIIAVRLQQAANTGKINGNSVRN